VAFKNQASFEKIRIAYCAKKKKEIKKVPHSNKLTVALSHIQ